MLYHRINRNNFNIIRKANGFVLQIAAIDLESGVFAAAHRDVSVHNAAWKADEACFSALTKLGQFEGGDFASSKQRKRRGDLERGRRTKTGAFGHGAPHQQPL